MIVLTHAGFKKVKVCSKRKRCVNAYGVTLEKMKRQGNWVALWKVSESSQ